jgi:hypothetical protein
MPRSLALSLASFAITVLLLAGQAASVVPGPLAA